MNRTYTKKQEDFIRNNFKKYTIYELTDLFNKKFKTQYKPSNIKDKKYDMGLVKYKQNVVKATYNAKEINFLKKKYKGRTYDELTDLFNRKFKRNVTRHQIREIKYKYLPEKTKMKCKHEIPIYSEYIDINGEVIIKVSNNKRITKARYLYEKKHGKIADNCFILHLDSNKKNNKLNNLTMVTAKELALLNRNRLLSKNKQCSKIGILITKLQLKTFNSKKTVL